MKHYYNEFDKGAAQWLRNLIAAGKLPAGEVDERDIRLVQPTDLRGFVQCHFFAGIGGWPIALRLAGWDEERPVWTGSCPCQPFSGAGKMRGKKDERHLWPQFKRLIEECAPPVVFGEQVASGAGHEWLAGIRTDLEDLGYAVGASDLCAAGLNAPHIRQRLFWVGHHKSPRQLRAVELESRTASAKRRGATDACSSGPRSAFWSAYDVVKCADGTARRVEPGTFPLAYGVPARVVKLRAYGNAIVPQVAAEFIKAYLESVKVQS